MEGEPTLRKVQRIPSVKREPPKERVKAEPPKPKPKPPDWGKMTLDQIREWVHGGG